MRSATRQAGVYTLSGELRSSRRMLPSVRFGTISIDAAAARRDYMTADAPGAMLASREYVKWNLVLHLYCLYQNHSASDLCFPISYYT